MAWRWCVSHRALSHLMSLPAAGLQWETCKWACSNSPLEPTVTGLGQSSMNSCMPWDSGMSSHGLIGMTM